MWSFASLHREEDIMVRIPGHRVKLGKLEKTWWLKTGACAAPGDLRGPGSLIRYN